MGHYARYKYVVYFIQVQTFFAKKLEVEAKKVLKNLLKK
jgi:hypothetical protein